MKQARTGWKQYLEGKPNLVDLDETLRICDMAGHYNHDHAEVAAFLGRAARYRSVLARQTQVGIDTQAIVSLDYVSIRAKCELGRLSSDEAVLTQLASAIRKNLVRRQRSSATKRKQDR
jgi:hypothetical protein